MKVILCILLLCMFSISCEDERLRVDIPPGTAYVVFPDADSLKFINSTADVVKEGDTSVDTMIFNGDTTIIKYIRGPRPGHEEYTIVQASGVFPNRDLTLLSMSISHSYFNIGISDSAYYYMYETGKINIADDNSTRISGAGHLSFNVIKRSQYDNILCDISPCFESDNSITVKIIFNALK